MFKKLSEKIGLTVTEIKVILFLLVVFGAGFGFSKLFSKKDVNRRNFDYSKEDSIFKHLANSEITGEKGSLKDKLVDSNQEVSDFKKPNFDEKNTAKIPAEKSIDINQAGMEKLILLPGIGEKTAENIVNYRTENGDFKFLNDLLSIKGIGKAKLNKIKKYIFIKK